MANLLELVELFNAAWSGEGDAEPEAKRLWDGMTPLERESFEQMLFAPSPVWDGDHISKSARDSLLRVGLVVRVCYQGQQGYTAPVYRAYSVFRLAVGEAALREGQKRARERFRALAQKTVTRRANWLARMWPSHRKSLSVLLSDPQ